MTLGQNKAKEETVELPNDNGLSLGKLRLARLGNPTDLYRTARALWSRATADARSPRRACGLPLPDCHSLQHRGLARDLRSLPVCARTGEVRLRS